MIISCFILSCADQNKNEQSDNKIEEDSTLHLAADSIKHGIWQPFLPDTSWQIPEMLHNDLTLMPSEGDSNIWSEFDTIVRPLDFPEGGPGDTTLNVIPAKVKLNPKIVPLIMPEPQELYPMRSVTNANYDIQYLDIEQGLPGSGVSELAMDSFGRLWLASSNGAV